MTPFILDWLNLLIRWAHVIAGIAWIGASFYFVGLDFSLRKRDKMNPGVFGTAWEVHGGGFYHVEKYLSAPDNLPKDLIWYKWEAYLTWLTGISLLIVQFYANAGTWMVDPNVLDIAPVVAIVYSVLSLTAGWFIYDFICKSELGKNTPMLMVTVFIMVLAAAYFYTNVFSARAALIHVGAFMGTMMAANVFAVIIPNQKKIVASLLKGEKVDPKYGIIGKQRSMHNTYLTLPVLFMMISGHYPMISGHEHAWLLVGMIVVGGASARHFLIKHEVGDPLRGYAWTMPLIFAALAVALYMTWPEKREVSTAAVISDLDGIHIMQKHCRSCHSETPTSDVFEEAPKSITFDSVEEIIGRGDEIIKVTVDDDYMPLGNETEMTEEERKQLEAWLLSKQ